MASVIQAVEEVKRPAAEAPQIEAPLIEASGLGVRRGTHWLVRGVDLTIRPGEIVTLIGPNGSGKSTTVKALLGILETSEGCLSRQPGLRIGYVPQKLSVDQTMPLTVRRLMTLTGRHDRAEIEAALNEVAIAHLAERPVQQLSGGEFQRALLARALIRRPQLLVLDEPVQGVDFAGEIALYELIHDIRERLGCGILMISHDLHIVMGQTDTVVCLNGHVCCSGTPQVVTASPEYRALFGSRAASALAIYRHDHDHVHLADGRVVAHDHEHDHSRGHKHGEDHDAG
ncbi:zinc ABC transporter ATP-binding protein ZnuC [Pelagibius litoralis]|uniref:Zinc ABC transporter ATP-binding protein ZnuC n=1 Tax=Pelagibius litoralis TaxID=374515 RepID=A0A967EYZ2_9PROT|nr:zinc ABC transporter ATP-binding protein ZnuC [Pelagibius litoralis]NIA69998.1 zinc ABC transporter ATP-binding protein ZnuC [Pelagibius litoralis]